MGCWELDSCIWLGRNPKGGGPRLQGPGSEPIAGLCLPQIATCNSRNGNPAPQITWYRNGQRLEVPMEVNSGERAGAQLDSLGAAAERGRAG